MRKSLESYELDPITLERIVASAWRKGTVTLYTNYLKKWGLFCLLHKVKPLDPKITRVAQFLRTLEDEGLGYGAINTARCALSVVLPYVNGQPVGKHRAIHLLLRAIYADNPPRAKYSKFWDVSVVFTMFKSWPHNKHLSVRDLGFKLALLALLVSGHRGQTIVCLDLDSADIDKTEVIFDLKKLIKSNRTGDPLSHVCFTAFPEDRKLCIVSAIREYVKKTSKLRKNSQLLISFIRPFGPISRDTLARWTIRVLKLAGVNTDKYASHSTRGAVATKARKLGLSVKSILKHAGWKTERSFARHYNKRIEKKDKVANKLLRSAP